MSNEVDHLITKLRIVREYGECIPEENDWGENEREKFGRAVNNLADAIRLLDEEKLDEYRQRTPL